MLLEGIFLPLTTPFYPDGRVYLRKLEHNVDRYSRTPAAGMLLLGDVSEAGGLTDEETRDVLASAMGSAAKEKVMIASVGRESVPRTLILAESAAALGYDAVAVRAPEFAEDRAMRLELMTYFQAVADRSPLPVVLVSEAGRRVEVEALAELAGHPRVFGLLDSEGSAARVESLRAKTAEVSRMVEVTAVFAAVTGRMLRPVASAGAGNFVSAESLGVGVALAVAPVTQALKTRTKKVGMQVLCGGTANMLEAWRAGAVGAVPRLGACGPQACCEVYQAFRDGDMKLAEEKQRRILTAAALMEGWSGIAAIKHGCDLNGYFGGRPRLPLLALRAEARAATEAALGELRN